MSSPDHEVLRDDGHLAAPAGQEVGGRRRRVVAVLVDDDDPAAGRHAAEDVGPSWRRAAGRRPGGPGMRGGRPVATTTASGWRASTVSRCGRARRAHVDARLVDLAAEPVGDHRVVLALRGPGGGEDLAPQRRVRLEEGDAMAPDRRHPRGLEPGRPAADDHDALRAARPGGSRPARPRGRSSGSGRSRSPCPGGAGRCSPRWRRRRPGCRRAAPPMVFLGQLGIGDERPRHPDQVADAGGERGLGLLDRRSPGPATITGTFTTRAGEGGEVVEEAVGMVEGRGDHRLVLERLGVGPADHPVVG